MARPQTDFSKGSVKKLVLSQALPLTMAQAVQLLYNIVDRIYIGHLEGIGDLALTGLGITFPVIVIIAAFTSLYGTGGATLFSIARGEGDTEEAQGILGNVFALLAGSSVVLFALCFAFRKQILFLFGASEQSFFYADQYLRIYLLGTVFSMLATGLNSYINAQGFPKIGMCSIVIGAVTNIALDPVFIFGFEMGVAGAALATVLSQAVSALWVLRFLLRGQIPVPLKLRSIRADWQTTAQILRLGTANFIMQGTNCLVQVACNTTLQTFGGDLYVGIMTVTNSVREIFMLPVSGIVGGAQPVISYNYGARKFDRVRTGIRFNTWVGAVYTVAAWLLIVLLPRFWFGIFNDDPAMIGPGARVLKIYFFGFVFMALQLAGQSTFQALGDARHAIFFSLLRKAIIVVPLTLVLPRLGLGVDGVFWAEPISNLIGGMACYTTMRLSVYRKLPKKPE